MSYANMDGVPTQTAGTSELLASDWNTYVRDNFDSIKFGHVVCTSSTRPTGIAEGTMIYETDTQKALVYSGSAWVEVLDLDRTGALPETSPGHLIVADNTAKTALTATEGMMVYQSDNDKVFVYSGSAWVEVSDITNGASNVIQRNVASTTITAASTYSLAGGAETDITGLTVSITPTSTSSKVLVMGHVNGGETSVVGSFGVRLKRDSTYLATGDANGSNITLTARGRSDSDTSQESVSFVYLDSPSSTSSLAYKIVLTAIGGTTTTYAINRATNAGTSTSYARTVSGITVMEVPV